MLDTNALLLMALEDVAVAAGGLETFASGRRYISHVCAIEIAIKHSAGKLPLPPPFQTDFRHAFGEMVQELGAHALPIELSHVAALAHLPLHHRDPFDRLIIAQALCEDLTVVTRDRAFALYPGLNVHKI
ncbi:MAG: type II toxin-antitoxin system VapC family toxin [Caulobacteraceae bacterium]